MSNYLMRTIFPGILLVFIVITDVSASELSAELVWSKRLVLSTTVTGIVDKVLVSPGQKLKKGETLLSLDAREFKAALNQASAKRLAAKTTYDEAKRELSRSKELFDRTMLSEHELQVVKNSESQAKADYLDAKAKFQQTEIALERSRIQAPFDSVVLSVQALPGQTILSSLRPEPLAVIAESERMIARAWLTSSELEKYSTMTAQQVSVGNRKLAVISQYIVREANNKGQYALEVVFESKDNMFNAGQAASIIFP